MDYRETGYDASVKENFLTEKLDKTTTTRDNLDYRATYYDASVEEPVLKETLKKTTMIYVAVISIPASFNSHCTRTN